MESIKKWYKKQLLLVRLEDYVELYSEMLQSVVHTGSEFTVVHVNNLVNHLRATRKAIRKIKNL